MAISDKHNRLSSQRRSIYPQHYNHQYKDWLVHCVFLYH